MTKSELIERVVRHRSLPPEVTKKRVTEILDIAFDELANYFARSRVTRSSTPRFTFPGFGTFTKKRRNARNGVNPRTLEPIHIEAQLTLDFKPSSSLRDAMNSSRTSGRGNAKTTVSAGTTRRSQRGSKSSSVRNASPQDASTLGRRRLATREEAELDDIDDAIELPSPRLARAERVVKPPLTRNG